MTTAISNEMLEVMGQMQVIRSRISNAIAAGKSQSGIEVYQAGLKALQERVKSLKTAQARAEQQKTLEAAAPPNARSGRLLTDELLDEMDELTGYEALDNSYSKPWSAMALQAIRYEYARANESPRELDVPVMYATTVLDTLIALGKVKDDLDKDDQKSIKGKIKRSLEKMAKLGVLETSAALDGKREVKAYNPAPGLDERIEDGLIDELLFGKRPENLLTLEEALKFQRLGVPLGVSYGMGSDSTAMLIKMEREGIRPDFIVFADTGGEKPETMLYADIIRNWLRKVGFPPLMVVRRNETVNELGAYRTLEEQCLVNVTFPSLAFGGKKCSQKWKVDPMAKAEKESVAWDAAAGNPLGKVIKAIGYDDGAKDSKRGRSAGAINPSNKKEADRYLFVYPLRDWKIDRDQAIALIEDEGLPLPGKSACFFCPSQKPDELRVMVKASPQLGRRLIRMEATAVGRAKKISGLWGRGAKGARGSVKRPGSMSEYIVGEELLPEFEGQSMVDPWWQRDGQAPQSPNSDFHPAMAWKVSEPVFCRQRAIDDGKPEQAEQYINECYQWRAQHLGRMKALIAKLVDQHGDESVLSVPVEGETSEQAKSRKRKLETLISKREALASLIEMNRFMDGGR